MVVFAYVLEARDGVEESGVERRVVLGQRDAAVEVDELRYGREAVGFGKAVEGVAAADFDELVGAALTQRQRVLAGLGGGVADEESAVGGVFHQVVDFLPRDVAPVPVGVAQRAQLGVGNDGRG